MGVRADQRIQRTHTGNDNGTKYVHQQQVLKRKAVSQNAAGCKAAQAEP